MRVIVLGAGAGGGLPQWNGNSPRNARAFAQERPHLSQCSIAVSGDGDRWSLLNASPDLRAQIIATPALHPKGALARDTTIDSVLLTNGDVDAIAGLLTLRERQRLSLYATQFVLDILKANPVFEVLNPGFVSRSAIVPGESIVPTENLSVTAFALPGKAPLYAEAQLGISASSEWGAVIGLSVQDLRQGRRMVFVPSCAEVTDQVCAQIDGADVLFFDGTLFSDDEMIQTGEGTKTARRMGHVPMAGTSGAIEALADVKVGRRIFIHVNNTNPALDPGSQAAQFIAASGWSVAADGMEIDL